MVRRRARGAASRRPSASGTVRSASPWISRSGTGSTSPTIRIGSVARGSPPRSRAAAAEHAGRRPRARAARGSATPIGDRQLRRHRVRRRRRRSAAAAPATTPAGASGSMSAPGSEPSPSTTDRGDRGDPAHRRPEQRDPLDPALAEPRERAGDILDLAQPERGRGVVRLAVAAEVERRARPRSGAGTGAYSTRSGATEPGPAVEQQDRLVRVGHPLRLRAAGPSVVRTAASARTGAGRRAPGGGRPRRPAHRSPGPSSASPGLRPRRVQEAPCPTPR